MLKQQTLFSLVPCCVRTLSPFESVWVRALLSGLGWFDRSSECLFAGSTL